MKKEKSIAINNIDPKDLIIESANSFYQELKQDEHGRFRSWEYCYSAFCDAREDADPDIDYLSLMLAFYLASWGMYRGSSFLLQKDYKVHIPVVKELLRKKYNILHEKNAFKLMDYISCGYPDLSYHGRFHTYF